MLGNQLAATLADTARCFTFVLCLPNNYDGEIQQIPPVAQVGTSVHHEPVRDDLHHALPREDHQEYVLDLFLEF